MNITKEDLNLLIEILVKRCRLICTQDPATNCMSYDQWLEAILEDFYLRKYTVLEGEER
jgi:hypothetical protein